MPQDDTTSRNNPIKTRLKANGIPGAPGGFGFGSAYGSSSPGGVAGGLPERGERPTLLVAMSRSRSGDAEVPNYVFANGFLVPETETVEVDGVRYWEPLAPEPIGRRVV